MNLMNIMLDSSQAPEYSIVAGGTLGMWDIARHKIIFLPIYMVYSKQAQDKDLIKFFESRINTVLKHINKIQDFFKGKDFDFPKEPNIERKLKNDDAFVVSRAILDDEEIAIAMREHLRAAISLETEALRNAVSPDVRELIYGILKEDNDYYSDIIKLQKTKNWADFPPVLMQQ
ncbi:MAG: DUF3231 family protein [Candidatus Saccharibacteria bacterium]